MIDKFNISNLIAQHNLYAFDFMKQALFYAQEALLQKELPVGCVIVKNQQIIASSYNQTEKFNNFLKHAEILAIEKACDMLQTKYLVDCEIFITLQPCPMCAHAIKLSRIQRVFFAASNINDYAIFKYSEIEVYQGILELQSSALLKKFFANRRKI